MPGSVASTTSPPLPPSPPAGPPCGTNFSRRNATQPLPPAPAATLILQESTNFTGPRPSLARLLEALLPRRQGAGRYGTLVCGLGNLRLAPTVELCGMRTLEGLDRQPPAQIGARPRSEGACRRVARQLEADESITQKLALSS